MLDPREGVAPDGTIRTGVDRRRTPPAGEGDQAYGNRVFLRHCCTPLAGPDLAQAWDASPADARAARGFNGDIDAHHQRWRREAEDERPDSRPGGPPAAPLGRRVARKDAAGGRRAGQRARRDLDDRP